MKHYRAACHCGQVEAICRADPAPVIICHCELCRRRTGSYFHVAVWFDQDAVEVNGETRSFTRTSGDVGLPFTFNHCIDCGTSVWWLPPNPNGSLKGKIAIAGGCFEKPDLFAPTISIYEKHKESWLVLPEGIQRYEAGF